MKIGEVIKTIRKYRKINQADLALQCEISTTFLSEIENDLKRPSKNTMHKICKVLEVPESLIYVMSTDVTDVPEGKRDKFNLFFPSLKKMFMELITNDEELKSLKT